MCLRYQWEYDDMDRDAIEILAAELGGIRAGGSSDQSQSEQDAFPASITPIIILENGAQKVVPSYFGLTPSWAKDPSFGKKYAYNGRGETIMEKPTFRDPFHFRRCLVKVVSFKENLGQNRWLKVMHVDPAKRLFIAGLFEMPNRHVQTRSHCLITTVPNSLIEPYHDRMPVILSEEEQEIWLNPRTKPLDALALIKPCESSWLQFEEIQEESSRKRRKYLDFGDD